MSRARSIRMVLKRATVSKSDAMKSCGSICVVYGLCTNPRDSTKPLAKAGQSAAGAAERWAWYEPVAPAILPRTSSLSSAAICGRSRATTLAISLPTVVGVAGCPCVCESIGTSASECAIWTSLSTILRIVGSSTFARASRSISAYDRLLMSSEVHAKWMNSVACDSCAGSGLAAATFSLR